MMAAISFFAFICVTFWLIVHVLCVKITMESVKTTYIEKDSTVILAKIKQYSIRENEADKNQGIFRLWNVNTYVNTNAYIELEISNKVYSCRHIKSGRNVKLFSWYTRRFESLANNL